ncbi:Telomere reverse transcriptase [Penicillium paradoxum]|uniref:Telomere reverse transcriptase n=1 Tax=Penicillium paradoxum TaxID=176176 RepID=UPI00254973C1|nr:Telomere reverse transcriptase [Penicillium paradoxum]KAJ5782388.1 Telomere reverse transcriptase [Penicillium paradoxum]
MGKKRKRPFKDRGPTPSSHTGITTSPRRFRNPHAPISLGKNTSHPVISLYYRHVVPLREYLLQQLPATSKSRRRRILALEPRADQDPDTQSQTLAELLDSTLVGVLKESSPVLNSERQREYLSYNSSPSRSILTCTDTGPTCPQSEVVDFVIWKLFNHNSGPYGKPQHLLTHGFQRPVMGQNAQETAIPGVMSQFPNQNVETLKQGAWAEILDLLGSNGEDIMMQLLFDCGIFAAMDARRGIYYQLSGLPLSVLEPLSAASVVTNGFAVAGENTIPPTGQKFPKGNACKRKSEKKLRTPNEIVFLRRRMLYGRAESKKKVPSGLGQTHVLNRFSSLDSTAQLVHVMKYIFPRQFGLLNVFMPDSEDRNSTDEWKGFMFRENEISLLEDKVQGQRSQPQNKPADADCGGQRNIKVPKRLRGNTTELVRKLRNRNAQCPYGELLRYYCPTEQTGPSRLGAFATSTPDAKNSEPFSSLQTSFVTQVRINPSSSDSSAQAACDASIWQPSTGMGVACGTDSRQPPAIRPAPSSLTDHATPASSVSAFCRTVIQKLIPRQFFGVGPDGISNFRLILRHVDRFIKLRRFESLSLHQVCKSIKITSIPWLEPPQVQTSRSETRSKISLSDLHKRTEILHEFIFWIFDAILIPLIRSNFYVTESQTHRNRLFYFRHDVWKQLIQQPFGELKACMFEELEPERAERVLARRSLGFGSLRLLPKSAGIRPILNLRKRVVKETSWGKGRTFLAPSINSSITPIFSMLTYERQQAPSKLGSSMLSVGDIHGRLKAYKEKLSNRLSNSQLGKPKLPPMNFVKLDIKACFDTIPQKKLLKLIAELVSEESYHISKHIEFQPPVSTIKQGKPIRKYRARAAPAMRQQHLPDFINDGPPGRKANTVFVDSIGQKEHNADSLLDLLDEHVRNNLVKIGKKYFRQRNGIPQGSVLSSILCNFFYAELEREALGFINPETSLLMRLVDDFLLITPNADTAMQFLEVMIRGQPSYGVQVNPGKSMANFSASVGGVLLPRLEGSPLFPYCGSLIDTHTLEIHRDKERILEGGESAAATLSDTLTVDATRLPGRTLQRKVLSAFRLQLHPMYIDDGHNSRAVVLSNLYSSFITSAMKMYHYMKSLRGRAHPGPAIIKKTIQDLIKQTAGTIQARRVDKSESALSCFGQRSHVQYLASAAFRFVLKRKQTRYAAVLRWLDSLAKDARPTSDSEALRMTQVVKKGNAMFEEWRF